MTLFVRFAPLAFALLATLPARVEAQSGQVEVRIDVLSYERTTGRSAIDVRFPGAAALALYLNDHVALESRLLGFRRSTTDGSRSAPSTTTTNVGAALFVPLHLGDARGRSGLFVAPGVIVNRVSFSSNSNLFGASSSSTTTNYGIDLGVKHTLQGRVSLRHALTYRTGDNLADTYGVTSGISIFFR